MKYRVLTPDDFDHAMEVELAEKMFSGEPVSQEFVDEINRAIEREELEIGGL